MIGSEVLGKLRDRLESDRHLKDLIKGSFTFFVIRILGLIVAYAFTLLVTRKLGASAWGIFTICFTILQVVSVVGRLGLDTALLRFIAQYNAQGKRETAKHIYLKSISIVIPFSLLLSVGLYLLAPVLAEHVFKKEHLTTYIKLIAFAVLPFTLLYINSESLRALKRILEYAVFQNLLPFSTALLLIGVLFLGGYSLNTEIVMYTYIIAVYLTFCVSYLLIKKEFINLNGYKEIISLKKILSVSSSMLISNFLIMLMSWTDVIMLGIWRTEKEVGIYNVAVKLSMVTSFTLTAINSIVAPKIAEFYGKGDIENLKKTIQKSTRLIFWSSVPILILYLSFPSFFMSLFGEEFKKGALVLVILALAQFVNAASGSVTYILSMTGNHGYVLRVILIVSLLNISLNYLLIPFYGIIGASLTSSVCTILWNIVFILKIKKIFDFYPFYKW